MKKTQVGEDIHPLLKVTSEVINLDYERASLTKTPSPCVVMGQICWSAKRLVRVLRFESDVAEFDIAIVKNLHFANLDLLHPQRQAIDLWELAGKGDLVGGDVVTPTLSEFHKVIIDFTVRRAPGPLELTLILLEGRETVTFTEEERDLICQKHDIRDDKCVAEHAAGPTCPCVRQRLGTCRVCKLKDVAANQNCSNQMSGRVALKFALQEEQYQVMKDMRIPGYVERMMDPPGLFVSEWEKGSTALG